MNVALDASPLTVATGGIARYTEELSRALAAEFPVDTFLLCCDRPFRPVTAAPPNLQTIPPPQGWLHRRWWSYGLPAALQQARASVFHGTDFTVPYRRALPSVMTIHDLSPWTKGPWQASSRVNRRTPWLLRFGCVTAVIAPTEAIRRQIVAHFGFPADRVTAIPLAAAPIFRPLPKPPADPYFLVVGTLEPRKNLDPLIAAWRAVWRQTAIPLKIAGRLRHDGTPPPPEPGLHWLGIVTDTQLAELYAGSLAVLMPSAYEGFGLPVVEAMQCGAPVLASRDPALLEVSGNAALHADSNWTEAMLQLARNAGLRAQLSQRGLARAAEFSWASTARQTYAVYQEAIRCFG